MHLFWPFTLYGPVIPLVQHYTVCKLQGTRPLKLFSLGLAELFGKFSASLFTMLQVASGDAWASHVARSLWMNNGDDQIDVAIALFFVSYFLLVGIVLLNGMLVCVV